MRPPLPPTQVPRCGQGLYDIPSWRYPRASPWAPMSSPRSAVYIKWYRKDVNAQKPCLSVYKISEHRPQTAGSIKAFPHYVSTHGGYETWLFQGYRHSDNHRQAAHPECTVGNGSLSRSIWNSKAAVTQTEAAVGMGTWWAENGKGSGRNLSRCY